jgi:hypothetical protein
VTLIDLEAAPSTQPRTRTSLPWLLFGVTLLALIAAVSALFARAHAPVTSSQIAAHASAGEAKTWVSRDQDGALLAVLEVVKPEGSSPAWCELSVEGSPWTAQTAAQGKAAVCVWYR